jgi:hypothetical protein
MGLLRPTRYLALCRCRGPRCRFTPVRLFLRSRGTRAVPYTRSSYPTCVESPFLASHLPRHRGAAISTPDAVAHSRCARSTSARSRSGCAAAWRAVARRAVARRAVARCAVTLHTVAPHARSGSLGGRSLDGHLAGLSVLRRPPFQRERKRGVWVLSALEPKGSTV